jgi:cation transport ATPase
MPVTRGAGGAVIGGTVCEEGFAYCRVTRTGGASALSQIIALVQRAQASKPPIQVCSWVTGTCLSRHHCRSL